MKDQIKKVTVIVPPLSEIEQEFSFKAKRYKPRLNQIFNDDKEVFWTVEVTEKENYNSLRFLRIKNSARLHDVIVGNFSDNKVNLENSNSQDCELLFKEKTDLMNLFVAIHQSGVKFYRNYVRPGIGSTYLPDESTLMSEEFLTSLFNHIDDMPA